MEVSSRANCRCAQGHTFFSFANKEKESKREALMGVMK